MSAAAATRLFRQLEQAKDAATTLSVAQALVPVLQGHDKTPTCSASEVPARAGKVGKALCPLLDAALQQRDWMQLSQLPLLDACTVLLSCLADHMAFCYETAWKGSMLSSLKDSGLLTALLKALSTAHTILVAKDSPAPTDYTFTQYLSHLLLCFSHLLRRTTTKCTRLMPGDFDDPLGPLLLPGAELAAAVLDVYAGPEGARIIRTNRFARGYHPVALLTFATPASAKLSPAALHQLQHSTQQDSTPDKMGAIVCTSAVANAIRVADSFALITYNMYIAYQLEGVSGSHGGSMSSSRQVLLAEQVLSSAGVSRLVACMLFVLVKQLHTTQAGQAATEMPQTSMSGRKKQQKQQKQKKQAASTASSQGVQVPPHHNMIASALGLDLLLADDMLFEDATAQPNGNLFVIEDGQLGVRPMVCPNPIDSSILDPLIGLLCILQHGPSAGERGAVQGALLASLNIRMSAHLNDKLSQAVLLTLNELCLLEPANGEHALRLALYTITRLFVGFTHFAMAGADAAAMYAAHITTWPDRNPFQHPDLQALLAPVLKDSVLQLWPQLLPECFDIPLPSSAEVRPGRPLLSGLLPQHIILLAGTADSSLLTELLLEHPLYITRALEAAIRVDAALESVSPITRCAVLRAIPVILTSNDLPSQPLSATAATAANAATTAPNKLTAAMTGANNRQLLLQLHALLTSVVKLGSTSASKALSSAASGAPAPDPGNSMRERFLAAMDKHKASFTAGLPPEMQSYSGEFASVMADYGVMLTTLSTRPTSTVGQFRGSLELMGAAAVAAASQGRAVIQAAAATSSTGAGSSKGPAASSGPAGLGLGLGSRSSTASSSSRSSVHEPAQLAAPFVSLIGRCLYVTGAALAAASKNAPAGLQAAEFDSCSTTLAALLSCLRWVAAEPAAQEVLGDTGGADAATLNSLCSALQVRLGQLQQPPAAAGDGAVLRGRAIADLLVESGVTEQLQAVGAAMCGVTTGVCGNPACTALAELSEIALVTPGGGKRPGAGKCAGCLAVSYCSRDCQRLHWRSAHKALCGHKQAAAAHGAAPAAPPQQQAAA